MRKTVLVCYDIACDRARDAALRRVRAFAIGGQKSCHECWVTPTELRDLIQDLRDIIDPETDRFHVFQLSEHCPTQFFGAARKAQTQPFLVI